MKIELFQDGKYFATTERHKTCKQAVEWFKGRTIVNVAGRGIVCIAGKITARKVKS